MKCQSLGKSRSNLLHLKLTKERDKSNYTICRQIGKQINLINILVSRAPFFPEANLSLTLFSCAIPFGQISYLLY